MRPVKKWGLGLFGAGLLGLSLSVYACGSAETRRQNTLYGIMGLISFATAGAGAAMYDLSGRNVTTENVDGLKKYYF